MMKAMLSPAEVAQRVGPSRTAIYRAIERGDLRAHELVPGRLRVDPNEVEAWKQRTAAQARRRGESPMPDARLPLPSPATAAGVRAQLRAMWGDA